MKGFCIFGKRRAVLFQLVALCMALALAGVLSARRVAAHYDGPTVGYASISGHTSADVGKNCGDLNDYPKADPDEIKWLTIVFEADETADHTFSWNQTTGGHFL